MKKIKCSLPAKCLAVILAVLSGTAAITGSLIVLFSLSLHLFEFPLDRVIDTHAGNLQSLYSSAILGELRSTLEEPDSEKQLSTLKENFESLANIENMEYGIIRAESLDSMDLSDKNSYLYYNFKTTDPKNYTFEESLNTLEGFYSISDINNMPVVDMLINSYSIYYDYTDKDNEAEKTGPTYWIISNRTSPVDTSKNDMFARQAKLLTQLYKYRYSNLLWVIFFSFLFLLMVIFCCYSAGCRKDEKSLLITWRHRLPLLPYLAFHSCVVAGCITCYYYVISALCMGYIIDPKFGLFLLIFLGAVGLLSAIAAIVNMAVRIRGHIFLKTTLTYYVLRLLGRIFRHVYRVCATRMNLFVKAGVIIAGVSFLELIILFFCLGYLRSPELLFFFWIVEKLILCFVVFLVLIQMSDLQKGSIQLASGNFDKKIDTRNMLWEFKKHGEHLNQIGKGMSIALEERLKSEHFKTELITNVSHDIKTPLTSLINYVDLLQKEDITEQDRQEYLTILERQSARLKKLIEDLIEASKASTGNLVINSEVCNIQILLTQIIGEFEEKLLANQLELLIQQPDEPVSIQADNRHLWRIFDNLMNNISKYAQPGTRVYINLEVHENEICIIFRNTSKYALNFSGEELTERFVRGDSSRNTEGSGLGLSIAQSLTEAMNGTLGIYVDGDLFKVIVRFHAELPDSTGIGGTHEAIS